MVFLNLPTLSQITTSRIPKLSEVRFLIVWLSLNHFLVHCPATTNFVHLQSTHTPHLQHAYLICIWSLIRSLRWGPFVEAVQRVKVTLMQI